MTPSPDVQTKLRRYLLGQLDKQTNEETEKKLLLDDELFEELLIVEDELTDDFLEEKLNTADRLAFTQHFLLPPERQQQLNFSRVFKRHVSASARDGKAGVGLWPGFLANHGLGVRATLIAISVSLVFGAIWLLHKQRTSQRSFATLTLKVSHGTRSEGSEGPKLKLPLPESDLRIVMTLPETSPAGTRYRAAMEFETGRTWTIDAIPQDGSVAITIPTVELERGRYAIKLLATEPGGVDRRISGSYFFTIE